MVEAVEACSGANLPGQPIEWLTDNDSPYVARERRSFANEIGLVPLTTAIKQSQSNGMAESFVKAFKRDCLQLEVAFTHYNEVHPHSALKMLSPRLYRRKNIQLTDSPCPV